MEYDIIVVGGGPAGLSAAVRAAWVAAPAVTYRARVLVLDAGDAPGGLSRWQPLVMNSPGVVFTKRELKSMLRSCDLFGVEIKQGRVEALRTLESGGFEVTTADATYQCLATVIATGCRLGHRNEHRLFHHNRVLWFHDNATLDQVMEQLDANDRIKSICLCGSEAVAATHQYLMKPRRVELRTIAEPPYAEDPVPGVERGRLTLIEVDTAADRLRLQVESMYGAIDNIECDVLIVDFNAYQKTASSLGFLQCAPRRFANGFISTGRDMGCDVPGLFAAGDATSTPFSVVKAMSEGTVAGFAAYAHVCALRTGTAPNLFPFFPYEI
ncbi:MAG: NAD(P)/FAD-dependent oxidoreductase [Gammaproteobacteria bacterium]|nr:NAD(P)/FAD-dependent oxidoreductase [Gammaproteobacteria bacterium]